MISPVCRRTIVALALLTCIASPAFAAGVPHPFALMVGDEAPPLAVDAWLRGPKGEVFEPGRVTVVEFWATWCGPCIAGIPLLSALADRYRARGVRVIGATSPDEWGNTRAAAEALVTRKQGVLRYAVAWLPESRSAEGQVGVQLNPWYAAAGIGSLPCAFVVDGDGRVAYIGDPSGLGPVIEQLLEGTFDREAASWAYLARRGAERDHEACLAVLAKGDEAHGLPLARALVAGPAATDPRLMLILAAAIADTAHVRPDSLLDVGVKAGEIAVRLTGRKAPGALDALAHARFRRGDVPGAIAAEDEAIALAEGPMRDAQRKELARFRAARER